MIGWRNGEWGWRGGKRDSRKKVEGIGRGQKERKGSGGRLYVQTQVRICSTVNRINGLGPSSRRPMSSLLLDFPLAAAIAFRCRDAINLEDFLSLFHPPSGPGPFVMGNARVTWATTFFFFSILFLALRGLSIGIGAVRAPLLCYQASSNPSLSIDFFALRITWKQNRRRFSLENLATRLPSYSSSMAQFLDACEEREKERGEFSW